MKRLVRNTLTKKSADFLARRTQAVAASATKSQTINELWSLKNNKTFEEVRQELRRMCSGVERCMYCEDSAGTDIDHFYPKSTYHDRAFAWDNYLLACSTCNSNYKRTQFPCDAAGNPELINPIADNPNTHLYLSMTSFLYSFNDTKGDQSIKVYGLNRGLLEKSREIAYHCFWGLITRYDTQKTSGDSRYADIPQLIRKVPHQSVLESLITAAFSRGASSIFSPSDLAVINRNPEIQGWI